jgi:ATP-dependent HslUV protease subunit HslV
LRDTNEFDRFWAIGSGANFALGAMYAVYDQLASAEEIAKMGIMAGAEFDSGSALPLTYKTITLAGN